MIASGLVDMMLWRVLSWRVMDLRQLVIRAGPREGSWARAWWNSDIDVSFIVSFSRMW